MGVATEKCFLCGRNGKTDPLDTHHAFGGSRRNKSEKYGLTVRLCHTRCHIFGPTSAHKCLATRLKIQQWAQEKAMREQGWDTERFIREFGRNYLGVNECK